MRYVRGFDKQILEALASSDQKVHYEAVSAAGNWEVDAAWPHITALLASSATSKDLLIAAIEAVATIRPREAGPLLVDLVDSEDEDISDAADEAMSMAAGMADDDFDDEEFDGDDEDEDEDEPRGGNHKTIH
jgi:HEAT repeat protein